MCKRFPFLCLLFALVFPGPSMAQVNSNVPDFFDQFFNNYYLLNPANSDTSYQFIIRGADKSQTGLFQGINKIYADADLKLRADRKESGHFCGIQVMNNREGDFIQQSRVTGRYSWRTMLSYNSSLSAGITLGFLNYSFKASQSQPGGSAFAPDASLGLWYSRDLFSFGVSAQQLFNRKIRPVNQSYELNRYYNFNATKAFRINHSLTLNTHLYYGLKKNYSSHIALATLFDIQEKLDAGISYRYNRALVFITGIKKIKLGSSKIALYLSYNLGMTDVNVSDNAIEFYFSFKK